VKSRKKREKDVTVAFLQGTVKSCGDWKWKHGSDKKPFANWRSGGQYSMKRCNGKTVKKKDKTG